MNGALRVWLIICIVTGPLLALLLPHNIAIVLIGCYLAGTFILVLTSVPERKWNYG